MPATSLLLLLLLLEQAAAPVTGVRAEDVTFAAGDITVAATLFLPDGPGPFPAIVIAHGSDAGTRTQPGKRRVGQRLASQGIAVLLPDKRGAGDSTGTYVETEWLSVLSADQLAGVRFLKQRSDIIAGAVGVMGNSQGGWVSQISAASGEVAFGVSISGPGVSPLRQVVAQRIHERLDDGMPAGDADELRAWWTVLWTYYGTAQGYDDVIARARALPDKPWFTRARGLEIPKPHELATPQFEFFRKIVAYEPGPTLETIRVPFLGVFGDKDRHIPMPESADAMRAAFARSGNPRAEVRVFANAGHGIQYVEGVAPLRGGGQEPLPGFISFLDAWLQRHAVTRARPGGGPQRMSRPSDVMR